MLKSKGKNQKERNAGLVVVLNITVESNNVTVSSSRETWWMAEKEVDVFFQGENQGVLLWIAF